MIQAPNKGRSRGVLARGGSTCSNTSEGSSNNNSSNNSSNNGSNNSSNNSVGDDSCPVCGRGGFLDHPALARHLETHFDRKTPLGGLG